MQNYSLVLTRSVLGVDSVGGAPSPACAGPVNIRPRPGGGDRRGPSCKWPCRHSSLATALNFGAAQADRCIPSAVSSGLAKFLRLKNKHAV